MAIAKQLQQDKNNMTEYRFTFSNTKEQVIKTARSVKTAKFLLMCSNRNNYETYKLVDKKPVVKNLKRSV